MPNHPRGLVQCEREAKWRLPLFRGSKEMRCYCTQHTKGRELERVAISDVHHKDSR